MLVVQICVGSSCHLKGSEQIVRLLQEKISEGGYEGKVSLVGSFCTGKCNRLGVTLIVDGETVTGVTESNFKELWNEKILPRLNG